MKKIAAMFVCFLSFSSEVFCCKQLGPSEYKGGIYSAQFMKMIREKTPGVEIKSSVEVSSKVTLDATKFMFESEYPIIYPRILIESRDFFIATAERLMGSSIDPSKIGESEAHALGRSRKACIATFGTHEQNNKMKEGFLCIGCLAYCGDSESLKCFAKMLDTFTGNLDLANRVYLAANTEGTTWEEHKAFKEQFSKSGIMEYFSPF